MSNPRNHRVIFKDADRTFLTNFLLIFNFQVEDEENIGQLSKRVTFQANVKNGKENGHKSEMPKFKAEGLVKMKKAAKIREKKEKKDRRRRDKVATELSDNLENAFEAFGKSDKYDFDKDFVM